MSCNSPQGFSGGSPPPPFSLSATGCHAIAAPVRANCLPAGDSAKSNETDAPCIAWNTQVTEKQKQVHFHRCDRMASF